MGRNSRDCPVFMCWADWDLCLLFVDFAMILMGMLAVFLLWQLCLLWCITILLYCPTINAFYCHNHYKHTHFLPSSILILFYINSTVFPCSFWGPLRLFQRAFFLTWQQFYYQNRIITHNEACHSTLTSFPFPLPSILLSLIMSTQLPLLPAFAYKKSKALSFKMPTTHLSSQDQRLSWNDSLWLCVRRAISGCIVSINIKPIKNPIPHNNSMGKQLLIASLVSIAILAAYYSANERRLTPLLSGRANTEPTGHLRRKHTEDWSLRRTSFSSTSTTLTTLRPTRWESTSSPSSALKSSPPDSSLPWSHPKHPTETTPTKLLEMLTGPP